MVSDLLGIGGGVQGLLAAWEARRRGFKVVLLDKTAIGREASWASAGMVMDPPTGTQDPVEQLCLASIPLWPGLVRDLKAATGIDVQYERKGWVRLAWDPKQEEVLE